MTAEIRELLELAAQAAGIAIHHQDEHGNIHTQEGDTWNPLESGDDLIDLMEKLSIDVEWNDIDMNRGYIVATIFNEDFIGSMVSEHYADHPTRKAALAMAVVRCAAEYQRRKG